MLSAALLLSGAQVTLYDVKMKRFVGELLGHHNRVTAVQLSPKRDAPNCLTAAVDKSVRIWDTQTLTCLHSHMVHSVEVNCAAFVPSEEVSSCALCRAAQRPHDCALNCQH